MRTDVVIEVLEIGGSSVAEVLEAPPLGTDAPAVAPVTSPGRPGRGDDAGHRVTAAGRVPVSAR